MRFRIEAGRKRPSAAAAQSQVDRLIAGSPARLEIDIAALPGTHDGLLDRYRRIFKQKGYVVADIDRSASDLWKVTFSRQGR